MKNNNIRGMKKNISLWKKIKLFNSYKKIVKDSKKELESKFNLRIDGAHRMYTVLNIPEELIGEEYSLRKSDIDKISENFITEYGMELKKFLDTKGLTELYEYYDGFMRTFVQVYAISIIIKSGQLSLNTSNIAFTISTKLVSLIPLIGENISSTTELIWDYIQSIEMINKAVTI